jgi:signal transduction histidine kinase
MEGFGLISIKERLESFKGRLSIKTEPGMGTTATIEIPVTNNKSKIK